MVSRFPRSQGQGRSGRIALIAIVLFLVVSISTIVGFYTDLLWYQEVELSQVFWTILVARILPAAVFASAFFVFALLNLTIVGRIRPVYSRDDQVDPFDRVRLQILPVLRKLALIGSAVLATMFGLGVMPEWRTFTLFRNAVSFGTEDPLFNKDIGYYVFKLPTYQYVYGWLLTSVVVVTLMVAALHYLTGGIRLQARSNRVSAAVKAHLSLLLALVAVIKAWGYRLAQYNLLYSKRGNVTGASYTDVNAELKALQVLVIVALAAAVLLLINVRFRGWTIPVAAVGVWVLIAVIAGGIFPYVVQRFSVEPEELQKEAKYVAYNIAATRDAYGLDLVEVKEYPAETGINQQIIESNPGTVKNIRLFDPTILRAAYRQLQEIRTYYEFVDVDVDRYRIDGELRQVMLSARELKPENLQSRSWVNNHLVYTHGYGAVVSPTNETAIAGQPAFLVQNIPPQASKPELEIKQGGIYFGEGMADYSVVNTEQKELDYGRQEGNQFTQYAGDGGVEVSGLLRRLAFAWRFRDFNLLISGLIQEDSRILYYRQIKERLQKAAPFIEFDGDPYPVITEGKIVWMADGYTMSNMYPYSERLNFEERTATARGAGPPSLIGENNYVRNAVKVSVDAYSGDVSIYLWDKKDPIIKAWAKAFPGLFKDASEMPEDIANHVRYPEDLFRIQTHLYSRYHVTDPVDFFTLEDRWVIPKDPNVTTEGATAASQAEELQPYYVLMRLPDAATEEYVLILPMNPRDRPNMVAWLAAKSGPEDYGKLTDFRFPKTRQIFGVGQVHARINSTESISTQITLLNQQQSRVAFGNLLVIPIDKSVLYVQPLFLQAERNAIPEMKF
ncbi:MAG TPA: UPF0182 family protein, partial [Actinomycetota bacterium]|nr:UPF0182 family protein [Actinomycetota bacterium]